MPASIIAHSSHRGPQAPWSCRADLTVFLGALGQLIGPAPASGPGRDEEVLRHEIGVGLPVFFVVIAQGRISTVHFVAGRPGETNAPVTQFLEFPASDLRFRLERDIIGNTGARAPGLPGRSSTGEPVFFRKGTGPGRSRSRPEA